MTYRVKEIEHNKVLATGLVRYKTAQQHALDACKTMEENVIVVNEDDDDILCIALPNEGHPYLSLVTSGAKDNE
jgi:hypothetical protein